MRAPLSHPHHPPPPACRRRAKTHPHQPDRPAGISTPLAYGSLREKPAANLHHRGTLFDRRRWDTFRPVLTRFSCSAGSRPNLVRAEALVGDPTPLTPSVVAEGPPVDPMNQRSRSRQRDHQLGPASRECLVAIRLVGIGGPATRKRSCPAEWLAARAGLEPGRRVADDG
jgi:hypothetical protein